MKNSQNRFDNNIADEYEVDAILQLDLENTNLNDYFLWVNQY
jgi:hypothetical protein